MSSEFERLLRQAHEALPEPDARATRRAREKALAAVTRPRRSRFRSPLALAAALVLAVGLGVALGALATPSGSAADGPTGLGFLPVEGWSVYQAGTKATVARPASAIATNVPLDPEDFVDGRPDPSQLPYSTLLTLPRSGVIIVADFTLLREHSVFTGAAAAFHPRKLPLDLRYAAPDDEFGTQIRPRRPLGQYQLRAAVEGYAVDLRLYFGTARPSRALLASAQRQLERLVVEPAETRPRVEPPRRLAAGPSVPAGSAAARVIDRTFRCNVGFQAGVPKIEVEVAGGARVRGRLTRLAQATINTFEANNFKEEDALLVAGMSAGWPPPAGLTSGGMSISLDQCTPVVASVPFTTRGLTGGVVDAYEDVYECFPTRRILVRTRALFRKPTNLRFDRRGGRSLTAIARITKGDIAARTPSGRPIFYAQVLESGKARMFTDVDCVPDPT